LYFRNLALVLTSLIVVSCSSNPVTDKKEIKLVSKTQEVEEVQIGTSNYYSTLQSQGGTFIIDPELTKYVRTIGNKLASLSDRPKLPYEFVVLNNSTPNAWALPGGKIGINRGLLIELDNEAELAAVLSHEIVHAAARHGAKGMERELPLGIAVATISMAPSDENNTVVIIGAARFGSLLISQKYGRDAELESDLYGMKYMAKAGYNPIAAVTLQEKFVDLSDSMQPNWINGMFASHPPSQERVQTNKKTALTLDSKGVLNTSIYQDIIANLVRIKPAYAAYDRGMEALSKGAPKTALRLAEKAIRIEPRESLFHLLKGSALMQQNKLKAAEGSFGSAIYFNPNYFFNYLQRGQLREKLNYDRSASEDYYQSIKLLPTAKAYFSLGNIALRQGNAPLAKQRFAKAAISDTSLGKKALIEFVKLDMPQNPNKYLNMRVQLNRYNKLSINIENSAPIAIKNISFVVSVKLNGNRANKEKLTLNQTINPGDKQIYTTQITTIPGKTTLKDITVSIVAFKVID